jgi:hypothetical protein
MAIALLNEKIERLETDRPVGRRRSSRGTRPARPLWASAMVWRAPAAYEVWPAAPCTGAAKPPLSPSGAQGLKAPIQTTP